MIFNFTYRANESFNMLYANISNLTNIKRE